MIDYQDRLIFSMVCWCWARTPRMKQPWSVGGPRMLAFETGEDTVHDSVFEILIFFSLPIRRPRGDPWRRTRGWWLFGSNILEDVPGMGEIPKNQDAAKKLWLQVANKYQQWARRFQRFLVHFSGCEFWQSTSASETLSGAAGPGWGFKQVSWTDWLPVAATGPIVEGSWSWCHPCDGQRRTVVLFAALLALRVHQTEYSIFWIPS